MCAERLTGEQKEFFRRPRLSQTELGDRPPRDSEDAPKPMTGGCQLIFCSPLMVYPPESLGFATCGDVTRLWSSRERGDRHSRKARQARSLPRAPIGRSRGLVMGLFIPGDKSPPPPIGKELVEDLDFLLKPCPLEDS
jgi:hypothetical protein